MDTLNYSIIYNKLLTKQYNDIDVNLILSCTKEEVIILLSEATNIIDDIDKSYKFENYKQLFELIVNMICIYNEKKNIILPLDSLFLFKLSKLNKGQIYLEKIKKYIKSQLDILDVNSILVDVCRQGTLPIYFFWRRLLKVTPDIEFLSYLGHSCINNDMRIFKYILENENIDIISSHNLDNMFNNIFDFRNTFKKQKKLLKHINEKIKLNKYFNYLIYNLNPLTLEKVKVLCKYYHDEIHIINFKELLYIVKHTIIDLPDEFDEHQTYDIFNEIYNLLITPTEKIYFIIIRNIIYSGLSLEEMNIVNSPLFIKVITENKTDIIETIMDYSHILDIPNKSPSFIWCIIVKEFTKNNYFTELLENTSHWHFSNYKKIIIYTRFYTTRDKYVIRINNFLHKLRCYAKKFKKTKINEIKLQKTPILNELKNFVPNKFISVLNNGSLNYQLSKQKFTTLPPRHIIPYEMHYLNSCLIKEKSDGINVTKLPVNIYPNNSIIINKLVKAEYIEELDLYLVYDISIDNMNIIERQEYIRNIHPFTTSIKNLEIINNMEELKTNIENERINLKNFIKSTSDEIKWYPKASFKINIFNDIFIKEINTYIEELNIEFNNYINYDGIVNNDGFIITPLDGSRELKIKPKSLMTIDLKYINNNWLDDNNNIYKNITSGKYKEGKIYRCYPKIENNIVIFTPKDIRYDKKTPNTQNICKIVTSLVNFNWLNQLHENNIYYQKTNNLFDNKIKKILEQNKTITSNYIKSLNPSFNKNWLDLGCGNCKFYNYIKIHNPKKYVGIDIDIKNIIKAYKKYNTENDFEVHNCDLNNNWLKYNLKLYEFSFDIKYDYIICNFSIMHFCNDLFWEQLNKISTTNTQFIFNVTLPNISWDMNNSYIKSNNTCTKIYLEWIHDKPIQERIITKDEILNIINKYGWSINKTEKNTTNNLISCYEWYFLIKL